MKATFLQILAVLFLASATTQAQMTDVTISASRKKLDEQKSLSKDSVAGIWFRAYAGGKLIGEYANPSTVTKKFDWKE